MTVRTCDFCGATENLPDHPFSIVQIADLPPNDACGPCVRALEAAAKPKPRHLRWFSSPAGSD